MNPKTFSVEHGTKETKVSVDLNIDGTGKFNIKCDIQFLKQMTEILVRYAGFDLILHADGDNDHHVVEDMAITFGRVLRHAMSDRPIERMTNRNYPHGRCSRDVLPGPGGPPPTQHRLPGLPLHFMRSFVTSVGMTLHMVVIRGFGDHHIVEVGFKASRKALRDALRVRDVELSIRTARSLRDTMLTKRIAP